MPSTLYWLVNLDIDIAKIMLSLVPFVLEIRNKMEKRLKNLWLYQMLITEQIFKLMSTPEVAGGLHQPT